MFCNSCGKELPEGTKFCNNCGAKITVQETEDKKKNEPKRTICNAVIKFKPAIPLLIIIEVILFLVFILGFKTEYSSHYGKMIYWYGSWGSTYITCVVFGYIILAAIPFLIMCILNYESKITTLEISNKGIFGTYNHFISQISVNTPIEHIDNMMIKNSFGDKLRGGKTLCIRSNAGTIQVHFVHNADEIVSKSVEYIENNKKA